MPEVGGQLIANSMPGTQVSAMDQAASTPETALEAGQYSNEFNELFLHQWLQNQLETDLDTPALVTETNPTITMAPGNTLPPAAILQALQGNITQDPDYINLPATNQNTVPVDGVMQAKLTVQQPVLPTPFLMDNMKLIDSADFVTKFDELNLAGTKPLQMFGVSQSQLVPELIVAMPNQNSAPVFTLNQSVSSYSSQAHLPPITVPLDQQQGVDQLNERINWMINSQVQKVDMRLEPAELGSLDVRVSITKDQANISFHVSNAQAREAIESAIPRLREMFNDSGVQLGNVDVSQHSFAEHSNSEQSESSENLANSPGFQQKEDLDDANSAITRVTSGSSLLDVFA